MTFIDNLPTTRAFRLIVDIIPCALFPHCQPTGLQCAQKNPVLERLRTSEQKQWPQVNVTGASNHSVQIVQRRAESSWRRGGEEKSVGSEMSVLRRATRLLDCIEGGTRGYSHSRVNLLLRIINPYHRVMSVKQSPAVAVYCASSIGNQKAYQLAALCLCALRSTFNPH